MELLERDVLLEALSAELASARNGTGRLVLLSGEAGVGKSAVTRAFCDRHGPTATVLWGACEALRTARPLGALHDIARVSGGRLAEAISSGQPRHLLFAALLDALTPPRGVPLVVIEDVHWADESTLDLLVFLGRRAGQTRALTIATYRDDEVRRDSPLQTVLGDLATSTAVRRFQVQPLSRHAVARLARHSTVDVDQLFEVSKGNAFYVTEVLAAGPGVDVPGTVRDAVLARVARLSPAGRAVLDLAAAVPDRADLALLHAGEHPADAIDECLEAGLLLADSAGIRFRHELARLAVKHAVPAARRAVIHGQVLAFLSSQPNSDPARLAYHAEEAGDRLAVQRFAPVAAAQAVLLGSHREAVEQYVRALRHSADLPDTTRADLLEQLASERRATGAIAQAVSAADEALRIRRASGDVQRVGSLLARRALYLWSMARNAEAVDSAEQAVALLEVHPPGPALAGALAHLAYLRMLARDIPAALETGRRAIGVSEAVNDNHALARALNAVGTAQWFTDPAAAIAMLQRSLERARDSGDDDGYSAALVNLGSGAGELRHYAIADHWLRQTIAWCAERDLHANYSYASCWLARVEFEQGRWASAGHLADSVLAGGTGYVPARIVALTVLGRLGVRRRDPRATEILDEAWRLALATGDLQRLWPVAAGRAEAAWLSGSGVDIEELVRAVYDQAVRLRHEWAIGELGYWLWRGGQAATGPSSERSTNIAGVDPSDPFARQMAGDWSGSAMLWRALGCPYEEAMARADAEDAVELRAALQELDRLSARPAADLVAQRLRQLGQPIPRRPRRSTMDNPGGLTNRETEILRLVSAGYRNAEIAESLHIATRTVDHHVSAILTKLGVASRREAATLADNPGAQP